MFSLTQNVGAGMRGFLSALHVVEDLNLDPSQVPVAVLTNSHNRPLLQIIPRHISKISPRHPAGLHDRGDVLLVDLVGGLQLGEKLADVYSKVLA